MDHGLLLISGGLDRVVKAWNFNFLSTNQDNDNIEAYLEYSGHSNWITCLMSLEDCENMISGDDNGEIIIWDVLKNKEKLKFTVFHKTIITSFTLIERYKRFASASSDSIRIWDLTYKEIGNKKTLLLCNCERSFMNEGLISSLISPTNYQNLLIIGGQNGMIHYMDIKKGKIILESEYSNQNKNDYIGNLLIIEKNIKIFDEEYEETSKNFNFLSLGDNNINIHDGYSKLIRCISPQNNEDFFCNQVLPNRNCYLLGVIQNSKEIIIRLAVIGQYSSQYYNYKSSRVTIVHIILDNLKQSF